METVQEQIGQFGHISAILEGRIFSYQHAYYASIVRQLVENLDDHHIAKSKCYVRFTSTWTMENPHLAHQVETLIPILLIAYAQRSQCVDISLQSGLQIVQISIIHQSVVCRASTWFRTLDCRYCLGHIFQKFILGSRHWLGASKRSYTV